MSTRLSLITVAHAELVGIPKNQIPFLLSISGIAGMVGRLLFGSIADHPKVMCLIPNFFSVHMLLNGHFFLYCTG